METCRIIFESVNEYGQIERHIHNTTNYQKALEAETKLQQDIQARKRRYTTMDGFTSICPTCGQRVQKSPPIWVTCFRCMHKGDRLFCNKCTRNSFAPSGDGKSDQFSSKIR